MNGSGSYRGWSTAAIGLLNRHGRFFAIRSRSSLSRPRRDSYSSSSNVFRASAANLSIGIRASVVDTSVVGQDRIGWETIEDGQGAVVDPNNSSVGSWWMY